MIVRRDLEHMKATLDNIVGQRIQLTLRRGKSRIVTRRGIIENTYPSIFIVKLEGMKNGRSERRISYSYADVLTKAVEVSLCEQEA